MILNTQKKKNNNNSIYSFSSTRIKNLIFICVKIIVAENSD